MGAVYLAEDDVLGRTVALKRTLRYGVADLLRFKREFRAIERFAHPNLVRLYELGSDDEGLYYTMEVIEGSDLATWCRGGDRASRLSSVLPQLMDALAFLHARGVIHCDLKPSNVLVDTSDTLKLLDFGVLAELSRAHESVVAGTPAYMAPERIRGEPATPATDAYALGCTMFEILAGRTPFVGSTASVMEAHAKSPPPRVSELDPSTPPDLDELCHALLAKDPADRPSLAQIGGRLRHADPDRSSTTKEPPPAAVEPAALRPPALLGRDALTRRLLADLEGGARPLVLTGPSGVGKSTLLDWLAGDAEARGLLVLRGATRSAENLPYNALDAAMDDLARALLRGDRPYDRRTQRIAAEAFPLLRAGSRSIDDAREQIRHRLFGVRERLETCTRREVFDAIARLLESVAAERGALLVIDDFQWADADSVALLNHVVERTSPSVRAALAVRSDVEPGVAHAWLEAQGARTVEVPPLASHDTMALIRRAAFGADISDEALAEAARACDGRAFLAEVAGRALARGSRATIEDLLGAAWGAHGDLFALLVTADGWTPTATVARILGRPLGSIDELLRTLENDGLVRRSGGALDRYVDLYHEGVRSAALARLGPEERSRLHGRIADHLLEQPDAPPQRLVRHLASAGRIAEAATHARRAAARAARQRAFSSAADMHAVVLRHQPGDRAVREARAWALERSSRYAEAAREWAALAPDAPRDLRIDIALHEAHALIAASGTSEGLRRLDAALTQDGRGSVRVRGGRALLTAARFLVGPIRRTRARRADPALRARAERHLKIGILLALLDPLTGMSFLQRARDDFLRAGADAQGAGCDYMFAILALVRSRDPGRVPLAERYVASARERARGLDLPPDVRGFAPFVEGLQRMRRGAWLDARRRFEEAVEIFGESTGTTETTMARSWLMMLAAHMQDMPDVRSRLAWFRRHAADCGGTLLVVHFALVEGYVQVLEGRFDEGFDTLTRAADLFDDEPPNAQRASKRIYRYWADTYRDDGVRARRELSHELSRAKSFRFMSTMYAGTFGVLVALIEANALRSGDPGASAQRIERLGAIVDASPPLWAGGASRARAYAADALGRPERALELLARAEREAACFDRKVDVAIARWQRGRRIGGDEGAALCSGARASVESLGVSPLILEEDAGLR